MFTERNWIKNNYQAIVSILNKLAIISPIVLLGGALFWIVPGLTSATPFTDYLTYIFGTLSGLILVTSLFAVPAAYLQTKYQPKKTILKISAVRRLTEQTAMEERIVITDWLQEVTTAKNAFTPVSYFSGFLQSASSYMLETPHRIKKNSTQESANNISTIHTL